MPRFSRHWFGDVTVPACGSSVEGNLSTSARTWASRTDSRIMMYGYTLRMSGYTCQFLPKRCGRKHVSSQADSPTHCDCRPCKHKPTHKLWAGSMDIRPPDFGWNPDSVERTIWVLVQRDYPLPTQIVTYDHGWPHLRVNFLTMVIRDRCKQLGIIA